MREPSDQDNIDKLIRCFFDSFDNRKDAVPNESQLVDLFAANGVIAKSENGQCEIQTPMEFAKPRIALLRSGKLLQFHEWEEDSSTQIVGDIAVRSSGYAKFGIQNGQEFRGRGSKFFQLAKFMGNWRIISLVWTDVTTEKENND